MPRSAMSLLHRFVVDAFQGLSFTAILRNAPLDVGGFPH